MGPVAGLGAIPLPEGWPAEDHDEPDDRVAAAKLATGMYEAAGAVEAPAAPVTEGV